MKQRFFFTFFLIIIIGIQVFFLIQDDCYPRDHDVQFSYNTIKVYHWLQNTSVPDWYLEDAYEDPPFIHIFHGLLFSVFGLSLKIAKIPGLIFYLFLLIIAFIVGKSIKNEFSTGFLTSFIISSIPMIMIFSRKSHLPFYSMVFLFLSFLVLIKSRLLDSSFYSVLLGFILGIMLLTHEVALSYYIIFLITILLSSIKLPRTRKALYNLSLCVFISLVISYIGWYKEKIVEFPEWFRFVDSGAHGQGLPYIDIFHDVFLHMKRRLFPIYYIILLLAGIYYSLNYLKLNLYFKIALVLTSLLFIFTCYVHIVNVDLYDWHFIGLYPFIGFLIAQFVINVLNKKVRYIFVIIIIVNGIWLLASPLHKKIFLEDICFIKLEKLISIPYEADYNSPMYSGSNEADYNSPMYSGQSEEYFLEYFYPKRNTIRLERDMKSILDCNMEYCTTVGYVYFLNGYRNINSKNVEDYLEKCSNLLGKTDIQENTQGLLSGPPESYLD